jgi:hypothetical protein
MHFSLYLSHLILMMPKIILLNILINQFNGGRVIVDLQYMGHFLIGNFISFVLIMHRNKFRRSIGMHLLVAELNRVHTVT